MDFILPRRPNLICLLLFLLLLCGKGFTEGVKQLMPDSTVSAAGLYVNDQGWYTNFACINCAPNYRLNIHISHAGEVILFGLKPEYFAYPFNLRKPNGNIVFSGYCPTSPVQTGYIRYFRQAMIGPFPQNGGYTPFSYTVTSTADTGDYYLEFAPLQSVIDLIVDYWDIQVVSGMHNPPIQADTINGRVWSPAWQLYADLGNFVFQPFNGKFFVYSDDGIVTKLAFSNAHVGAVTIFCNPYGCYNTGNFSTDRQSVNTNTFISFPGIAQYKVFLNNPDSLEYPSGDYGQIIGIPYMVTDSAYPPCSPNKEIVVEVNKPGMVETTIVFPYGAPQTNVDFYTNVFNGANYIPWNGLDGLGNPVPTGTLITVSLNYVNGLTNLPIWDQERNPDGYTITLVRPGGASVMVPMTYWDDSKLTTQGSNCPVAPQSVNLTGCLPGSIPGYPGCHPWGLDVPDCHDKMINTWWYGSASSAIFTALFISIPPNAIGHDSSGCGPGLVMLKAEVQPGQTVDWYDSISGGNLLLAGSKTFITPYLNFTTTYYAQARDTAFNCLSAARTPVTAFIKVMTIPEISGPAFACVGSGAQLYTTQAGMLNYQWYVTPGGQIITGQGTNSITVQWFVQGNQSVVVLVTDPDGCIPPSAIIHVMIGEPPGPAGEISGPSPLCSGTAQVVFSVAPIPEAFYYVWTLPPGLEIIAGWGSDSVTINVPPGSTSGYINVYAVNSCGEGPASPPFLLGIHDPPGVSAGTGDTLCQGTRFALSQATAENTGSFRWRTSGQGTFSDPSSLNPLYIPAPGDTGQVILTLVGYALPPCADDSSSLVLYYNTGPGVDAGENGRVCEGSNYLLSSSYALNYQNLQWTSSGSGTFSDPGILHPQYQPSSGDIQNGKVTLTLSLLPKPGCSEVKDSMQLEIGTTPSDSAGSGGVTCGGNPFRVQNAQAANYSHLFWTDNGKGQLSGDTTLDPVYTPTTDESGDVMLTLHVAGIAPCSDTVASLLMLTVYTGLTVAAGPDQLIPDSSSTFLGSSVKGGSGEFSYNWEPASLLVDPAQHYPQTHVLTKDTLFILTVKDLNSICQGKDSMRVRIQTNPPKPVENCILVHNVITPNGDGLNDKLIIDCIESYPDNTIQFFTRWGDRVRAYEHYDNKDVAWDGKNEKGEPLPDGTYYYVLTVKGIGTITGWVFIRDGSR